MSAASSAASAVRRRVALVTGGNKGIGLEIVRQLASADPQLLVLLGSRDPARGKAGAAKLGLSNVTPLEIDVTSPPSIAAAAQAVKKAHPEGLDLLINNAGVFLRGQDQQGKADVIDQTMAVNYVGPRDTCVTFWPLLNKNARSVTTDTNRKQRLGVAVLIFLIPLISAFSLVLCLLLRSLVRMSFQCGERGQSAEQERHDELLRRAPQAAPRNRFHREGRVASAISTKATMIWGTKGGMRRCARNKMRRSSCHPLSLTWLYPLVFLFSSLVSSTTCLRSIARIP
jgi:hypothetical protein